MIGGQRTIIYPKYLYMTPPSGQIVKVIFQWNVEKINSKVTQIKYQAKTLVLQKSGIKWCILPKI